jgi:hypothetical protein
MFAGNQEAPVRKLAILTAAAAMKALVAVAFKSLFASAPAATLPQLAAISATDFHRQIDARSIPAARANGRYQDKFSPCWRRPPGSLSWGAGDWGSNDAGRIPPRVHDLGPPLANDGVEFGQITLGLPIAHRVLPRYGHAGRDQAGAKIARVEVFGAACIGTPRHRRG